MAPPETPWIVRPQPLLVPADVVAREPPRPPELREPGYEAAYDADTVFYDLFWAGRSILGIGPPGGSLTGRIEALRVSSDVGRPGAFVPDEGLDRVGRFWAAAPRSARDAWVSGPLVRGPHGVGPDLAARMRGRRAVVTVSKDNDLAWIRDWGTWYTERHGADALVVYDNGSTKYSHADLWHLLSSIPGVATACVVDWQFKYGPIAVPPARLWDSNYAQHGALEHARWRLLRQAAGLLNVDIDELVSDPDGRSVFDFASTQPCGAIHFRGTWVYPGPDTTRGGTPRHADAFWVRRDPLNVPCAPKWCAVPSRLPRRSQLTVHRVEGIPMRFAAGLGFWHAHSISTNWDQLRAVDSAGTDTHVVDQGLRARLSHEGPAAVRSARKRPRLSATIAYLPTRLRLAVPTTWKSRLRSLVSRSGIG